MGKKDLESVRSACCASEWKLLVAVNLRLHAQLAESVRTGDDINTRYEITRDCLGRCAHRASRSALTAQPLTLSAHR